MSEAVVVIHGWDQVLTSVPALLGFHPSDSLVFVTLKDTPSGKLRTGVTCRVNLADYRADRSATAEQLAPIFLRNGASKAIAVFYGGPIDRDVIRLFAHQGIELIDVLATDNQPSEVDPRLVEASALKGYRVQHDRAAVAASVAYRKGVVLAGHDDLLAPMLDSQERDRVIAIAVQHATEVLPVLIAACQATGDEYGLAVVNLLVVTAVVAYRTGDGVTSREALARAQGLEPNHRLALLADSLLSEGMPPEDLDTLASQTKGLNLESTGDDDLLTRWRVAAGVPG